MIVPVPIPCPPVAPPVYELAPHHVHCLLNIPPVETGHGFRTVNTLYAICNAATI